MGPPVVEVRRRSERLSLETPEVTQGGERGLDAGWIDGTDAEGQQHLLDTRFARGSRFLADAGFAVPTLQDRLPFTMWRLGCRAKRLRSSLSAAGQAGVAMSEHLSEWGVPHLVLERDRIAERWRSERWDSLVANGPAWHDRFPGLDFVDLDPDAFASKEQVADYFVAYAEKIAAPIRCGVEVNGGDEETSAVPAFESKTSDGDDRRPLRRGRHRAVPAAGHPADRSRRRGPPADPLQRLPQPGPTARGRRARGRRGLIGRPDRRRAAASRDGSVYLSVGPARPAAAQLSRARLLLVARSPRTCGTRKRPAGAEHVTIAVSGAHGGHTVDFRALAARRHRPRRQDEVVRRRHPALRPGSSPTTSPTATRTTWRCWTRPTPTSSATASISPQSRRPASWAPTRTA